MTSYKKSHKTVEIKVFLNFSACWWRSRLVQIITDLDPDPGAQKTYGTYGYGSGTLAATHRNNCNYHPQQLGQRNYFNYGYGILRRNNFRVLISQVPLVSFYTDQLLPSDPKSSLMQWKKKFGENNFPTVFQKTLPGPVSSHQYLVTKKMFYRNIN